MVRERGSLTTRTITWAIGQLRREHATIAGLARRLGTSSKTLWLAVKAELVRLSRDESRFAGVRSLGVDEHLWHHVDVRKARPERADRDGRPDPRRRAMKRGGACRSLQGPLHSRLAEAEGVGCGIAV